jgi:quinol monooxygenase YgiN
VSAPESAASSPVAVLIEWRAPSLGIDDARRLAEATTSAFRRIPGLRDIRFFGDFSTGVHYYLQTWESEAAHDAYMASEAMFSIRDLAASYVDGRPSRRILTDYSPAPGA